MLDFLAVRFLYGERNANQENDMIENFKSKSIFDMYLFIDLLVSLLVAYMAYRCNENLGGATQIFYTIVAFLFSIIYFIFYLVYHIIMGVPCP
jgi:hypothetical protein